MSHAEGSSTVTCADGLQITGCFVLDATGHARSLVEFDKKFDPGYQVQALLKQNPSAVKWHLAYTVEERESSSSCLAVPL